MQYSYGLNVHFELDPEGDDYAGSPATWRRTAAVPHPSRTILLAECMPSLYADHFMCHQWSSLKAARTATAHTRHAGRSHFLFLDGHVERLPIESTFDPAKAVNRWNPSLAGKN
jgi:prepilin-type processing-associated H-X9-DG protein